MTEKTSIRCRRCGTLTSWTPYCPTCGAYLEFAGDPPWVPAPTAADTPEPGSDELGSADDADTSPAIAPVPADGTTTASDDASLADTNVTSRDEEPASDPPHDSAPTSRSEISPLPISDEPTRRPTRRIGGEAPWWRFWDRPVPVDVAAVEHPTEVPPEPTAEPVAVVDAPAVPATVLSEAPARQADMERRTVAVGRDDELGIPGGEPCPQCRFRNAPESVYCGRCGFDLTTAVSLAPATSLQQDPPKQEKQAPRRRDWGCATVIVIALLLVLGVALTPPGRFLLAGVASASRSFLYWIVPDVGTPVTYQSVTADSVGFGTGPKSLAGVNLQTYWTSAAQDDFGAGSTLTFTFTEPTVIDRMLINPGIQNGRFGIRALATPHDLELILTELAPLDGPAPTMSPTAFSSEASTSPVSPSPSMSPSSDDPVIFASPDPEDPSATTGPSTTVPTVTPTPTATATVAAELPLIVSPNQWTSIIQFDPMNVQTVTVRIVSVYPPALRDVYVSGTEGQVAITNISFYPKATLGNLFENLIRIKASPEDTPSPTPSTSDSGATPSPASTPTATRAAS